MNIREAVHKIRKDLAGIYDESEAGNIASLVIEDITGLSREDQMTGADQQLVPGQLADLERKAGRLKQNEPVQYVLQKAWFYGLQFFVNRDVLIPRPETEELVHWIIQEVKATNKDLFEGKGIQPDETRELKLLDVGTGSGCIALALKKNIPRAEVWGCDVSEPALNVARRNGSELNVRVDFQGIDFLDRDQQKQLPTVHIVVSNPPYVPFRDKSSMHPNVVDHEPHTALFVPNDDALVFYRALAHFGKHRLYPAGAIYMEIHAELGKAVQDLFEQEGYEVIIRKDMQGKDRMVKATLLI